MGRRANWIYDRDGNECNCTREKTFTDQDYYPITNVISEIISNLSNTVYYPTHDYTKANFLV